MNIGALLIGGLFGGLWLEDALLPRGKPWLHCPGPIVLGFVEFGGACYWEGAAAIAADAAAAGAEGPGSAPAIDEATAGTAAAGAPSSKHRSIDVITKFKLLQDKRLHWKESSLEIVNCNSAGTRSMKTF